MKAVTTDPHLATTSLFRVTLAQSPESLLQCQRLRYMVFNLELHEGLSTSDRSGLDIDPFDSFCDHLMVRDLESGKLVGTYRLQTGETAQRYLIGCSSISSQDENYGAAMYETLKQKHLVEPALRTEPQPGYACQSIGEAVEVKRPPRLFRAYLDISGKICGPPAIDREFKTIDFLTVVDLYNLPDRVRTRFF